MEELREGGLQERAAPAVFGGMFAGAEALGCRNPGNCLDVRFLGDCWEGQGS
jgi:hypothetical protein